MTTDPQPWVELGEPTGPPAGFFDEPTFLDPGDLLRWRRENEAARSEEARREAEAQERADARYELAVWSARQHALARGHVWDPAKPFQHWPSIYQRMDAAFAAQDANTRRAERQAAEAAGLGHLLHQGPPSPSPSGAAHGPGPTESGAATRGVPLMTDPRTDTSAAGKARRALRRWTARERRQRFEVNQ
jgi:hypothetical protein